MKKRLCVMASLAALVLFCAGRIGAQVPIRALEGQDVGIIFNVDDILFDFESYQGGVGLMISGDKLAYRLLVDFFASTQSDSFDVTVGGVVERHIGSGRVEPYLGGYLTCGYGRAEGGSVTTIPVPATVGGLFGVELHLLRFFSIFAEYDLSVTMSYSKVDAGAAGSVETTDWTAQIGTGNQSKIGMVFYFQQGRDLKLEPLAKDRK
jgi:hypothetical protein